MGKWGGGVEKMHLGMDIRRVEHLGVVDTVEYGRVW